MPEIKHNFTSGKMNKDLDERLVPNGEYRDAMNIQVSTSEDSDVGTVQNILGNQLVDGQDFISETTSCVASVSDERNDKLYWFIVDNPVELVENGSFNTTINGWTVKDGADSTTSASWDSNGEIEISGGPSDHGVMVQEITGLSIGQEYIFSYECTSADSTGNFVHLYHPSTTITTNLGSNASGVHTYTFTATETSVSIHLGVLDGYTAKFDNVSMSTVISISRIVEYDTRANLVSPICVDIGNSILQFEPDRLITGVNIIDDMLFWTDNFSEPKKINITRFKQGTDASGVVHTKLINDAQSINYSSNIDIKEEHITVIRKSPQAAPIIELFSERDPNKTYAGVMRITDSVNTLVEGGSNEDNDSSLWVSATNPMNNITDFSTLGVGSEFSTNIETNITGESGFELDWQVGDILAFKEFGGPNSLIPPQIPLTNSTMKCKIISGVNNHFTDDDIQITTNSEFNILNYNSDGPRDWTSNITIPNPSNGDGTIDFDIINRRWDIDLESPLGMAQPINYGFISQIPNTPLATATTAAGLGGTYKIKVEVSNYISGRLYIQIVSEDDTLPISIDPANSGKKYIWRSVFSSFGASDGFHEIEVTLDNTAQTNWIQPSNRIENAFSGQHVNVIPNSIQVFAMGTSAPVASAAELSIESILVERLDAKDAVVDLKVISFEGTPAAVPPLETELRYVVDKVFDKEKPFEFKFPRFAYRYKYEDNEYSAISPFSQVAFLPGSFDYHPKKGFNLGMRNRVNEVKITGFTTRAPKDVVSIDLLYKEDMSTSVYVLDTITPKQTGVGGQDNIWNKNEFTLKSEQLQQVLPSNQLLRPWDAVPRKALAQSISGNRLIYGNYVQNYSLKHGDEDFYVDMAANWDSSEIDTNDIVRSVKSIKSLRDYQLGVVFIDKYGRETPVLTNHTGNIRLDKDKASKENKIRVSFNNSKYPGDMRFFKFFIKETSGEYYNLALDRYFEAGDSHVWLSFPSSDRNKVDEETFLHLKKAADSDDPITEQARYKILAIENNAPDFIKQRKEVIAAEVNTAQGELFFTGMGNAPLSGKDKFNLKFDPLEDYNLDEVIKEEVLYIEFLMDGGDALSERYRITNITTNGSRWSFKLDEALGDDVNFITDDVSGQSPTQILTGAKIRIYKYFPENQSKFDGRFFAKILRDDLFSSYIVQKDFADDGEYRLMHTKKLYYLSNDHTNIHKAAVTGMDEDGADGEFFKWAPYFRNYKFHNDSATAGDHRDGHGTAVTNIRNIGQYRFDSSTGSNFWSLGGSAWRAELVGVHTGTNLDMIPSFQNASGYWIRSGQGGGSNYTGMHRMGGVASPSTGTSFTDPTSHVKSGDSAAFAVMGGEQVLQPSTSEGNYGQQEKGDVWFIDEGPYEAYQTSNTLSWGTQAVSSNSREGWIDNSANVPGDMRLHIGMGGIYNPKRCVSASSLEKRNIDNFFNIYNDGGNSSYSADGENAKFLEQFKFGTRIRFREDPHETVYQIEGPPPSINLFNTNKAALAGQNNGGTVHVDLSYNYPFYDNNQYYHPYYSTGSYQAAGITLFSSTTLNTSSGNHMYTCSNEEHVSQLSPNFRKSWELELKNMDPDVDDTTITWNPINGTAYGAISGGLNLTIAHSTHIPSVTDPEFAIAIDDITATDATTGEVHAVTVGMMVYSYNNGGVVLNGTTTNPGTSNAISFDPLIVKRIDDSTPGLYILHLCGYTRVLSHESVAGEYDLKTKHKVHATAFTAGQNIVFKQPYMNGLSAYSANRLSCNYGVPYSENNPGIWAVGYNIEVVEPIAQDSTLFNNPAIFETEPKDTVDVDIYYEASDYIPLTMTNSSKNLLIPPGSTISIANNPFIIPEDLYVYFDMNNVNVLDSPDEETGIIRLYDIDGNDAYVQQGGSTGVQVGDQAIITKPDGSVIQVTITALPNNGGTGNTLEINTVIYSDKVTHTLGWHNCFSFGNGVESNRVRDDFNLPFVATGVKASTTLEGSYFEEYRKYGLIYSGIYNGDIGINNLNQFVTAEKITKDINPIHGSIQKLHARDTDLITLCEDKVLKVLIDKDALYNADGNPQLLAQKSILGQSIPFIGEYGISKNPESFTSESYRAYFTDKVRGAVMRLSKDGLTPISNHGMKDWFRDNLKLGDQLIGSYDDRQDEYNITLHSNQQESTTVSFKEDVRGWVSFKSFIPESAVSCANDYFTMKNGQLYQHHDPNQDRNTFYSDGFVNSTINVILNESPGSVKSFHTLDYEGSQSKIDTYITTSVNNEFGNLVTLSNAELYNLTPKNGWYVSGIETDKQQGGLIEFIEKEGKWFNYIKGLDSDISETTDFGSYNIQGIGIMTNLKQDYTMEFDNPINTSLQIGDIIYYQDDSQMTDEAYFTTININSIIKFGTVTSISEYSITVDGNNLFSIVDPQNNAFIMFTKNQTVNTSSLLGYYADIKLENNSITKAELFSIGSEVSESSK